MKLYDINHKQWAAWVRKEQQRKDSPVRDFLKNEERYLRSFIRSGDRVLDIGCGFGRAALQVAARAQTVICLDANPDAIDEARRCLRGHRNVVFIQAQAEELPIKVGSIDAVLLLTTFGNLGSEAAKLHVLRKAHRVLAPGGRMLLTVWRRDGTTVAERLASYGRGLTSELSLSGSDIMIGGTRSESFSRSDLNISLTKAGFSGIAIHELGHFGLVAEATKPPGVVATTTTRVSRRESAA